MGSMLVLIIADPEAPEETRFAEAKKQELTHICDCGMVGNCQLNSSACKSKPLVNAEP
jgi:hypothetical protein